MRSKSALVPITRAFLASYYDKHPFPPISDDVSRFSQQLYNFSSNLQRTALPMPQGVRDLLQEVNSDPPHKVDENMWKNREQIEEIMFLLDKSHWPKSLQQQSTREDSDLAQSLQQIREKCGHILKIVESFQSRSSENVFNTVMTYMPQDFRGVLIRKQRERSEKSKKAQVDLLINSGGSIRDRYALLWHQQMERRRQLAQLGSAAGVYKTVVKYLVGVPQVLLDFVRQINDDQGPMEEQRHRYGPPLYSLTKLVLNIHLFLSLSWWRFEDVKLQKHQISILEEAVNIYASELERFLDFIGEVFANSPFFVTAEEAGSLEVNKCDEYKEASVPAGTTHEVSLEVESVNSYIAWDFSVAQGKISMDIGFSIEYMNSSGRKTVQPDTNPKNVVRNPYTTKVVVADLALPEGNFCTILSGKYKLIWDNSFSTFFRKTLRYKVDCIAYHRSWNPKEKSREQCNISLTQNGEVEFT